MTLIPIATQDDPRLAPYRQLKETNASRRDGLFVCEGEKLVRRLAESRYETVSLLVGQRWADEFAAVAPDAPHYVVPDDWVEQIIGFNFHRGVLSCGRRRPPITVSQLCENQRSHATFVVCPDVQDPENLGAILRIAGAFGVDGVVLGPKTADPFSRRVLRVSMGASLRLPLATGASLADDLRWLTAQANFACWATVLDEDALPLNRATRPARLAILFGSEGHGLERELVELCQQRITIPMPPDVDSLNVSIAAGIFLYTLSGPR